MIEQRKPSPGQPKEPEAAEASGLHTDTYAIDSLTEEVHGPLTQKQINRWRGQPLIKLLEVTHQNQYPPEKRRAMVCLAIMDPQGQTIH